MRYYQWKAHCQRLDPSHISKNYLKWKIDLHWVSSFTKHSVKVKLMTFRSNLRSSLTASEKSCLLSTFLVGHTVTKYLMKTKNVRCWRNIILKHYGWGFNQSLARHIIHWTNDSFSTLNFENPVCLILFSDFIVGLTISESATKITWKEIFTDLQQLWVWF